MFLVLYSVHHRVWKIADFGITADATSKRGRTTKCKSGTPSYRAPEILQESSYTNKVDIWALGCIFYEIICDEKAFNEEWKIYEASEMNTTPKISLSSVSSFFNTHLSACLDELLAIDWLLRPSASTAHALFHAYCKLLHTSITREFNHVRFVLPFNSWKQNTLLAPLKEEVYHYFQLSRFYSQNADKEAAVAIWKELINDNSIIGSQDIRLVLYRMADKHLQKGHNDAAISLWINILRNEPNDRRSMHGLLSSFRQKGDSNAAITSWREMLLLNPNELHLRDIYWEQCLEWKHRDINTWATLLANNPDD